MSENVSAENTGGGGNAVRNIAIGCGGVLVVALICVGMVVGYGAYRTNQDRTIYLEANEAYQTGDCDTALAGYVEIEEALRLSENQYTEAAAEESVVCRAYLTVANEEDASAQLSGYRAFIDEYNDTPVADVARNDLNALLVDNDPEAFVNTQLCGDTAFFANPTVVDNPDDVIPPIMLACGILYEENEDFISAIDLYRSIADTYASSDYLDDAGEAIIINAEPCFDADLRGDVAAQFETAGLTDYGADLLFGCAELANSIEEYNSEVSFLDELRNLYPDYRPTDVEDLLATALVNFAEQAGGGEIEQPEAVQTDNENVVVYVENASDVGIRIVFSGAERRVEVIPPCTDCGEGSQSCQRTDLPNGTYELPPGTYTVVVEATDGNVIPFTGTWQLDGGFEYPNCFFITNG